MSKLFKVLVTGGVGSGKSTACKMFEELGYSSILLRPCRQEDNGFK